MRVLAALVLVLALAGSASGVYGSTATPRGAGAATGAVSSDDWSVLGEYRVSPRPTSVLDRSREPIVTAHPFDASRLAAVYPRGGEASIRSSG